MSTMIFPSPSDRAIHDTALAIDRLRRHSGCDTREWNDGLIDILTRTYIHLSERLDSYDKLAMEEAMLKLPPPIEVRCPDCMACDRHANSDSTTPGFFYRKCEKHRIP